MCGVRPRCGQKDAYMDNNHLAAYLSDHPAESVMAVDLLTERESIHQDTKRARALEPILKRIARRAFAAKSAFTARSCLQDVPDFFKKPGDRQNNPGQYHKKSKD
jgi:hypothetical protein